MSQDYGPAAKKAGEAVRAAHNDFRSLYKAVSNPRSMPTALHVTGNTLDSLAQNLDLLTRSTNALSSDVAQKVFDTHMSDEVKLSDAILHDMTTVASRLRLMTPSASSEPVMAMEDDQCRDIENMATRYDQAISSILLHHSSCVQWHNAATMIGSPSFQVFFGCARRRYTCYPGRNGGHQRAVSEARRFCTCRVENKYEMNMHLKWFIY
jgi:hypothetical protein